MTFEQFLKELARLPKQGWRATIIRSEIRLTRPGGSCFCHCPITAVCSANKGTDLTAAFFRTAARALRILTYVNLIVNATDYKTSQRLVVKKARKRILTALNLQETA